MPRPRKPANPFRYFNSSPEIIRLMVMMYVRFPLSLRNVEDLLFERGIDVCHETVRFWQNNRAENSHLPFRRRERAMQRFRRMKSLQKLASVHASFHNHFSQERHLVDRQTYKLRRSVALAEWQSLVAGGGQGLGQGAPGGAKVRSD